VLAPILLVALVFGVMLAGSAAPTEAVAVGAGRSLILVMLQRRFSVRKLYQALENTLRATATVLWTICSANLFVALYVATGDAKLVED
jgi:TRAP-type mannitol/chloroaromatic compound transport system permease large subunit